MVEIAGYYMGPLAPSSADANPSLRNWVKFARPVSFSFFLGINGTKEENEELVGSEKQIF